jgi:hypothetical protein
MNHWSQRVVGGAAVLAGIMLALWIVFGSPHGWEGGLSAVRIALGLVSLGVISGGARLVFSGSGGADR